MHIHNSLSLIALFILTVGCTNLAPNTAPPNVAIDRQFDTDKEIHQEQKVPQKNYLDLSQTHWREYFLDQQLQSLISRALNHNYDLNIAALNIAVASEQYGINYSNRFPSPNASLSYQRNQTAGKLVSTQYQASLGLNGYEIDFFSRVKNLSKAALNQYLKTIEARKTAKISIISAVAKAYYRLQSAYESIELLQQLIDYNHNILPAYQKLAEQGVINASEFADIKLQSNTVYTNIAQQKLNLQQAKVALATLIGSTVKSIDIKATALGQNNFPKQAVLINTPSRVLLSRPDIIQAEYQLKIENANIGAARARLFPSIRLTNNLGYSSTSLSRMTDTNNWSLGVNIDIPLFDLSRRNKDVNIAYLNQKTAIENYKKTVRNAFKEVADTLAKKTFVDEQYQIATKSLIQSKQLEKATKRAFELNTANINQLINSQKNVLSQSQTLSSASLDKINNQIDLFMVLGGKL